VGGGRQPLLGIRDDLRVAPGHVQHHGIVGASDLASHLNVSDAVVDADQRLVPQQAQGARGDGDGLQRRAHPRPLGVADAVDVRDARVGLLQRAGHERRDPCAVVLGYVLRQEAFPRRRDVRVSDVGEHFGRLPRQVLDQAHAELVRGAFET